MQQATHVEDGQRQRPALLLRVESRQVGCRGIWDGSADIEPHDQVGVAEVGSKASSESRIWFVYQEKGGVGKRCEVAHLRPLPQASA